MTGGLRVVFDVPEIYCRNCIELAVASFATKHDGLRGYCEEHWATRQTAEALEALVV